MPFIDENMKIIIQFSLEIIQKKTSKKVKKVIIELEMNIYLTEMTLKCKKIPVKIKHKMKEI